VTNTRVEREDILRYKVGSIAFFQSSSSNTLTCSKQKAVALACDHTTAKLCPVSLIYGFFGRSYRVWRAMDARLLRDRDNELVASLLVLFRSGRMQACSNTA
jgi:hypothetical protein